jgi:hypothetical protein
MKTLGLRSIHILAFTALLVCASTAHATYELANNGKTVGCYADDNQSWSLNKKRNKLKYTVEGESLGARPVINTETDGKTFVAYSTDEGTLTLGLDKDTYQFAEEDEAWEVTCQ